MPACGYNKCAIIISQFAYDLCFFTVVYASYIKDL